MKTVSQLDAMGYFVGSVIADKSPLEDGVFLIPGGSVDFPPISVPEGFKAKWNGSGFDMEAIPDDQTEPEKTEEELANEVLTTKKAMRQEIVDSIVVTVSSGKVFDGNEEAQSRMSRAIQTAEIDGIESTTWVLANNVPTVVTLPELKEALVLSMQAMGAVWATPYEA